MCVRARREHYDLDGGVSNDLDAEAPPFAWDGRAGVHGAGNPEFCRVAVWEDCSLVECRVCRAAG
eukprot:8810526-Lingulodinium_polyedra.AAC.1